ncbi:MAG: type I methionyl aminopeptidase [Patescibacteria group bacterium]|nr:type I methionyl aminopeptidase [Patescibacteria group bacterium]MDE2437828.1 type I methionyl aminopeptidase [Patescibacteria group bacterium]
MIRLKTQKQIHDLREGGKRLAHILETIRENTKPGISLLSLDELAEQLIRKAGGEPAFKGYTPSAATKAYPNTLCTSVNDVAVHEHPTAYHLKDGDIVSIDIGMRYNGLITDMAITVPIGKRVTKRAYELIDTARRALEMGMSAAESGNTLGDIGYVIEQCVREARFKVLKELTGHGVGFELHEDPYVFNTGKPGTGMTLETGLVIAIEPIIAEHTERIVQRSDESFATADGSLAAHFEHSLAITEKGPLLLTAL